MIQCPATFDGVRCQGEEGHLGMHYFDQKLPPDVARVVASLMTDHEEAARRADRQFRRARVWTFLLAGAVVLNIAAVLWRVVNP